MTIATSHPTADATPGHHVQKPIVQHQHQGKQGEVEKPLETRAFPPAGMKIPSIRTLEESTEGHFSDVVVLAGETQHTRITIWRMEDPEAFSLYIGDLHGYAKISGNQFLVAGEGQAFTPLARSFEDHAALALALRMVSRGEPDYRHATRADTLFVDINFNFDGRIKPEKYTRNNDDGTHRTGPSQAR